jgi:hypothetical protein
MQVILVDRTASIIFSSVARSSRQFSSFSSSTVKKVQKVAGVVSMSARTAHGNPIWPHPECKLSKKKISVFARKQGVKTRT